MHRMHRTGGAGKVACVMEKAHCGLYSQYIGVASSVWRDHKSHAHSAAQHRTQDSQSTLTECHIHLQCCSVTTAPGATYLGVTSLAKNGCVG